jgi:hypothetical protein
MRRKTAIARLLRKLAPLTTAAVLVISAGAHAQLGAPNGSMTQLNSGMSSASPSAAGSGIPLGAVELGTSGLSPAAPLSTLPGLFPSSPSFPSNTGMGIGAGGGSSLGFGLSSTLPPTGLAPTGTGAGPAVTNFGPGGTQPLPGTSGRGSHPL